MARSLPELGVQSNLQAFAVMSSLEIKTFRGHSDKRQAQACRNADYYASLKLNMLSNRPLGLKIIDACFQNVFLAYNFKFGKAKLGARRMRQ